VPREHGLAAIRKIQDMHEQISPLLFISEIRTIAADTLLDEPMLSATLRRDPLHLETELARSSKDAGENRGTTDAVQCSPALGQALRDVASPAQVALYEAARFSKTASVLTIPRVNSATNSWTRTFSIEHKCIEVACDLLVPKLRT